MTTQGPNPGQLTEAFHQALRAAEAFAGATAPNPPVGCAILDAAGAILACEAHRKAGGPHAEAAAITACRQAGLAERIHTVVVTLEPCNHHGRTPPCVDAVLATPAKAVWIGARDPNPCVAGNGAGRLEAAGLRVAFARGAEAKAASRLIAPFAVWSREARPWLTLKQALTAAGTMTPPPGRKTFTSETSLDLAHALRRRADAIITGSGCILADDPDFTVRRIADHPGKRRHLAILDRRRRVPPAYLDAARARGLEARIHGDLDECLDHLAQAGVLEALVEAGPTLLGAFLERGLWDQRVIIRQSGDPTAPDAITHHLRKDAPCFPAS